MANPPQLSDPFASIKQPEFRLLLTGRFMFIMALRMMSTVVGWWMYNLTNTPLAIGLIGLSEFLPAFGMALYAGHTIDISDKRRLILKGVSLYLLSALVLLFLSTTFTATHLTNHRIALCIYAVIFCTGIIRAFTGPTFNVILASIVPRQHLQNATTWNQGTWLTASVCGHATGGFLIAGIGNTGTLACITCLIVVALTALFYLQPRPAPAQPTEKNTWESVKEGLRFVLHSKEVLGVLSLDLFAVLFGGAVALVPVFARDILRIGPRGFGFLNAAADIGAIFIVIVLTLLPMRRQQGKKLLFAVAGFGICIITFALSKVFWLSFAALLVAGMLDGVSVVVRGTIMQLKTPDSMRGRVMSVNSMFINSSNELGQFESGLAARLLGTVPSVVFGGCMTLLVVIITAVRSPAIRKLEY
jgi:MFS family permease